MPHPNAYDGVVTPIRGDEADPMQTVLAGIAELLNQNRDTAERLSALMFRTALPNPSAEAAERDMRRLLAFSDGEMPDADDANRIVAFLPVITHAYITYVRDQVDALGIVVNGVHKRLDEMQGDDRERRRERRERRKRKRGR